MHLVQHPYLDAGSWIRAFVLRYVEIRVLGCRCGDTGIGVQVLRYRMIQVCIDTCVENC